MRCGGGRGKSGAGVNAYRPHPARRQVGAIRIRAACAADQQGVVQAVGPAQVPSMSHESLGTQVKAPLVAGGFPHPES